MTLLCYEILMNKYFFIIVGFKQQMNNLTTLICISLLNWNKKLQTYTLLDVSSKLSFLQNLYCRSSGINLLFCKILKNKNFCIIARHKQKANRLIATNSISLINKKKIY